MDDLQMISLTGQQWSEVNRVVLAIHEAQNRGELVRLAVRELPGLLGACCVYWNEHRAGRVVDVQEAGCFCFDGDEAMLRAVIARRRSGKSGGNGGNGGGAGRMLRGIYDFRELVGLRGAGKVGECRRVDRGSFAPRHRMAAHFFVGRDTGVVLTASGERKFGEARRAMLAVLREHFQIACRRLSARGCDGREEDRRQVEGGRCAFPCAEFAEALSRRERDVFPCLLAGKTNSEISIILGVSCRTVEKHVASILSKAGVENRRALMAQTLPGCRCAR